VRFGHIGRLVARIAMTHPELELVGVNDLVPADNLAYLFKYDSVHGPCQVSAEARADGIVNDGQFVPCMATKDPAELPWGTLGTDYVVESTGLFSTAAGTGHHLKAGAKRVIIAAPTKDPDQVRTFVVGVNHTEYDPAKDVIVSNASCTTNCLTPVAKVLNDHFGIAAGLMTTVHAMTASQPTVDGPSKKDWRGGRGAYPRSSSRHRLGRRRPSLWSSRI